MLLLLFVRFDLLPLFVVPVERLLYVGGGLLRCCYLWLLIVVGDAVALLLPLR